MKETSLALALSGLAFIMAVIWGNPLLRILKHFKIGKMIRVEGPESHVTKMGTPTMGGLMIILPVVVLSLLFNAVSLLGVKVIGSTVILPVAVMIAYALLGAIDDWEGIRGPRRGIGMRASTKFILQIILALITVYFLRSVMNVPDLRWPGTHTIIDLGGWYIPIATFIIVGMSNAVNLTDGLDGLAGLISATAFASYGAIALMQGDVVVGRFCFILVGALFGFLWFNVHPAMLFMGDLGSLSLGAVLGVVSLMTGQWILLPLIAVIPISNVLSDILQVGYFKITHGKRLFKMAPLHHHFELSGWSETQVVQRFWLISLLCAMFGIAIALS